jgi:putative membrane protein
LADADHPVSLATARSRLLGLASGGLAAGIALFTAIVVYLGVGEIARTLAAAGTGLVWVALFHVVPLAASALGWHVLLAGADRPRFAVVLSARWIAESINQLLPALYVGGNVVRAQWAIRAGVDASRAAGSVVVDITLHLFAQLLFTALGLSLLVARLRGAPPDATLLGGFAVSATVAVAFYVAQRRGLFAAAAHRLRDVLGVSERITAAAGAIDAAIDRLYRRPRILAMSAAWHVASWLLGVGETWLALRFLGHPVDLTSAVVIESLGEAIRTVAFAVPGALGVQEGGFVLLGDLFGLTPEVSVALSLARRVRELALGIPGLVVWQLRRR